MSNLKILNRINLTSGMLFYTPIMTLFLLQHNISVSFLIAAQTAFSIGMMFAEVPTGVLADKYGHKLSLRIGLLLDTLGMVQLLFVRNDIALLAYFVVRGVSVALRSGSDEALLYDSYKTERQTEKGYSKAYGHYLSQDLLGFIIASAIAGVAVQLFGAAAYTPLIIATGVVVLVAFGLTFRLNIPETLKAQPHAFKTKDHIKQSLALVRGNRTIFALLLAGLLTLNGEYFLRQSYQPYFQTMMVPAVFLGVALAAGKVLNYLVIRWSHVMEKHLTVDQILMWINGFTGLLFVALAAVHSPWAIVAVFILLQGLFNAERPVVSDYVNQQIESFQRATVLSTVSFVQNIGQVVARLLLAGSIGLFTLGPTYAIQGAYMLVGTAIGVWYLRRCGCVHKVSPATDTTDDLALVEELA